MSYCSDCDKDVEFKSIVVKDKLTHFCPDCGESNLFKNKDVYENSVELIAKIAEENKERELRHRRVMKEKNRKKVESHERILKFCKKMFRL